VKEVQIFISESENEENLGRGKRLKLSKPQFGASSDNNVSDSEYLLLPVGIDIIQYFEYIIFN